MTAPEPRRVFLATITLAAGTGTAVYTRDLAFALLRPVICRSPMPARADLSRTVHRDRPELPRPDDTDREGRGPGCIPCMRPVTLPATGWEIAGSRHSTVHGALE